MKIKQSCSTALKALLVLGLLMPWGVFAEDIRLLSNLTTSSPELSDSFEEELEENVRHLVSTSAICLFCLEVDSPCFMDFIRMHGPAAVASISNTSSGWMVPLRI